MALQIEPKLPQDNRRGEHSPELEALWGSKILRIGWPPELDLSGGGLAIEYENADGQRRTLLLAFSELGLWVEKQERARRWLA